jgi:hypothetical protein
MDQVPAYLLIVLFIVFLAWRATRRQNQRLAAARSAEQARNSFTLEDVDDSTMRGFTVVDADGTVVDLDRLDWQEHGMHVADMRAEHMPDAPDFVPGAPVRLVASDSNPALLEVWNNDLTRLAGTVPIPDIPAVEADCLVLQERLEGGRRVSLRLLLMREDMLEEEPGST